MIVRETQKQILFQMLISVKSDPNQFKPFCLLIIILINHYSL